MDVTQTLDKLGFSPNEIKIYVGLLEYGSLPAGKVSKTLKLDRSSCYNSLTNLVKKGFVSYVVKANVKEFQAVGPRRLLDYLKEQEQDVKEILPILTQKHKATKVEGQVRMFKGIKGVKSIFHDIARSGHDNFVFGSEGQFSERMPEFSLQFDRLKSEQGIKTKMLIRKGRRERDKKTSDYRYIDADESPAVTNIYGDKIAIIIWTSEPEGIIIENPSAAKAYKSYFDLLWATGER